MKTIEEFIKEIEGSADLQNEIKAIKDKDALAELLEKNNVEGTAEDFGKALQEMSNKEGEISDEDAGAVAGGWWRVEKYWGPEPPRDRPIGIA